MFAEKFIEYDTRLHQTIEFAREKGDDKHVLKQEHLTKLSVDLDNRLSLLREKLFDL